MRRIVANVFAADPSAAKAFYGGILGLDMAMDHGWIVTYAASGRMHPEVSVAMEGGSGTPVPDLSIEVDDFNEVHRRLEEGGFAVEYGPAVEPWGVRRLYVRDPFGKLVNILEHV